MAIRAPMPNSRLARLAGSICLLLVAPVVALAGSFSFVGNFTSDDQVEFWNFSVSSAISMTARTWSFAGGTNALGAPIPGGGFAPVLSLFDSTGILIASDLEDSSGTCLSRATDSPTGACWDAILDQPLAIGSYTLALSEDDNTPVGPSLTDGFSQAGQGNFTGPNFGPGIGSFIMKGFFQRSNFYAVDLTFVDGAAPGPLPDSSAPEPGTASLWAAGLLTFLALRRPNAFRKSLRRSDL